MPTGWASIIPVAPITAAVVVFIVVMFVVVLLFGLVIFLLIFVIVPDVCNVFRSGLMGR